MFLENVLPKFLKGKKF